MRRVTALLILPLLTACDKPPAPVVVLDEPEAQLTRTLQQVSNVVELPYGRVAFAELADRSFLFADLATGDITPVGEHADTIGPSDPAPGKHKYPGYVFRLGGDTVGLVDFAAERTTLWHDQGRFLLTLDPRGVGRATGLAEAGSNIVVCSRKLEKCEEIAHRIKSLGVKTLALRCDLAREEEIDHVIRDTIKEFGRIDILVNNAGRTWGDLVGEFKIEGWKKVIDVNVTGTFQMTQKAGREMIKQKSGKIINIASYA